MDFLDQTFASAERSHYVAFLGLGNNKQKATAQNTYEADIMNRYPFSNNCLEQKQIVQALEEESRQTLNARNNAKKNSKARNDLTGKLRAFDQYIPAAKAHLNNVACSDNSSPAADSTNNPLNTKMSADQLATLQGSQAGQTPVNWKKYALTGAAILAVGISGFFIIRKLKKSA